MQARFVTLPIITLCVLARATSAGAQTAGSSTGDDQLRKDSQNPVAGLISVPFQNNTNFPIGPNSRVQDVLNVQPVIPIALGDKVNLITRWIVPIVYQPDLRATSGGANGLGDLNPTFFFSPAKPGALIWGLGPTLLLPTATHSSLGQGKWGAGPSAVLVVQPSHWTIGMLANNVWSYAGDRDRPAVNQFLLQYFVNYNMKGGWYVASQPILTANWRAPANNIWTIPFGLTLGRITRVGHLPLNVQAGTYYTVFHPQDLPYAKWQVRLTVALLLPKAK